MSPEVCSKREMLQLRSSHRCQLLRCKQHMRSCWTAQNSCMPAAIVVSGTQCTAGVAVILIGWTVLLTWRKRVLSCHSLGGAAARAASMSGLERPCQVPSMVSAASADCMLVSWSYALSCSLHALQGLPRANRVSRVKCMVSHE